MAYKTAFRTTEELDKWIIQNRAEYTGDYVEGVLLDNFILSCKRGYAFVREGYVSPWCSEYLLTFVSNDEKEELSRQFELFSDFECAMILEREY